MNNEIKVTQLPSAEQITQDDLFMVVQNNENKKATARQLSSYNLDNYYTKSETDTLLNEKADISDIPSNDNLVNVGSSVDTDYKVNVLTTKNLYNMATNTNGKVIVADGSEVDSTGFCISDYIAVQPNTTYTISRVYENLPSSEDNMRLGLYTQNKTWIERVNSSNKPYVYTTPSNCYFIRLSYQYTITNTNVQVELGSEATTYEEFIPNTINVNNEKYTDTINVGTEINNKNRVNVLYSKNMFALPIASSLNDVDYTTNTNGTINLSGTANANTIFYVYKSLDMINIKDGNTYTLFATKPIPSGVEIRLEAYNGTTWQRHLLGSVLNNSTQSITANANLSNTTQLRFGIYVASGSNSTINDLGIQFQQGNATTFEPYITPSINVDGEEIYNANVMNYDTTERVIGAFMGKPLYRKCIYISGLPSVAGVKDFDIANNLGFVKSVEGSIKSGVFQLFLNSPRQNNSSSIGVYINTNKLSIEVGSDRSSYTGYAIVEYTKTTD